MVPPHPAVGLLLLISAGLMLPLAAFRTGTTLPRAQ